MKINLKVSGMLLIIAAIIVISFAEFTYVPSGSMDEAGKIVVDKSIPDDLSWLPFAGMFMFMGGVVLVLKDRTFLT